jgi:hypothetical protein
MNFIFIFALLINSIHAKYFTTKTPARCNTLLMDSVDKPSCRGFNFMKLIPLSKTGKNKRKFFAKVDDLDYDWLMQWNWCVVRDNKTNYAVKAGCLTKMHRILLGLVDPKIKGHHIDHDGLNNQRNNLKAATESQNMSHRSSVNGSSSKYLGVSWCKRKGKWEVKIQFNKKSQRIGYFKDEVEAAKARDIKAKELHGEFANLNFI